MLVLGSRFSIREAKKPCWDNMKIHWGDKNIFIILTQKHTGGWAAFKCQNTLQNMTVVTKASLRIGKRTQYTHSLINKAIWNQVYLKKSKYIYLDWLYNMIDSLAIAKTWIVTVVTSHFVITVALCNTWHTL